MDTAIIFALGFVVACSMAIGVYFIRFWKGTGDRLFLMFALAFWLLALGWLSQAVAVHYKDLPLARDVHLVEGEQAPFVHASDETTYLVYIPRLLAFCCIIYGIIHKNRANRSQDPRSIATGP